MGRQKFQLFSHCKFIKRFRFLRIFGVPVLLHLFVVAGTLAQQAIRLQSYEFDPTYITVGDPIQLRLLIEADENLQLHPEPLDLSNLAHIEVQPPQVKRIKPEKSVAGKASYEVTYPLRAFVPGKQALPSITIKTIAPYESKALIQTPVYSFEVQSVKPAGATGMKSIKPPLSPAPNPLVYILMALLISAIVGILIFLYLRKRSQATDLPIEVPPQHPLHEIAYERLKAIEEMHLVAQGKMKVYHTEIAQVIRQYIEAQYNIPALELTTADLLAYLSHEGIEEGSFNQIRNFFADCNLVKFASYQPSKPEAHVRMEEAYRIIDVTMHNA